MSPKLPQLHEVSQSYSFVKSISISVIISLIHVVVISVIFTSTNTSFFISRVISVIISLIHVVSLLGILISV